MSSQEVDSGEGNISPSVCSGVESSLRENRIGTRSKVVCLESLCPSARGTNTIHDKEIGIKIEILVGVRWSYLLSNTTRKEKITVFHSKIKENGFNLGTYEHNILPLMKDPWKREMS